MAGFDMSTWTLAGIILAAGIITALSAVIFVKKSGTRKKTGWTAAVLVGIAVLAIWIIPTQLAFLNNPLGLGGDAGTTPTLTVSTTTTTSPTDNLIAGKCLNVERPTIRLSAQNKFTAVPTGGTHRYKIDGGVAQTVSDAGTFSASPFQELQVLWGNASDGTYFGAVMTYTIPCEGTFDPGINGGPMELYQNGTVTINIFNEEGNLLDGISENETLGSGDVANLKIEIRATNQRGFPYGGVLTLELNGTDFDEENTELEFGDLVTSKTNTPDVHSLTDTDNKVVSWDIAPFEGAVLHTGTITLDVATDNNPGDTNDPLFTFRPKDHFINEDTGGSFDGPAAEDEDNVATFAHITTATIHVD